MGKVKIMDNIHKYYYMIAFTAYMREMAEAARGLVSDEQKAALTLPGGKSAIPGNQLKLGKTFVTFMDAQPELRGLIDQGKGNLQWERDIPAAALANLSRATTGCVIACLFKEFQINASFEGLVETVPGVNLELLKMDRYVMDSK